MKWLLLACLIPSLCLGQARQIPSLGRPGHGVSDEAVVGSWDASSSDARDWSPFVRHGTFANGASATTSFKFDGTDDWISSIGSVSSYSFIQNTLVFSISCWIKLGSTTARSVVMGNTLAGSEKGFFLIFENLGAGYGTKAVRVAVFKAGDGFAVIDAATPNNAITDTAWHHIAVKSTGTGNNVTFYIDGVSQTTTYNSSYTSLSSGDSTRVFGIGAATFSSLILTFNGSIDDLCVFNRALTDGEVRQLYETGKSTH